MRIDDKGVVHFDGGGDVDPYFRGDGDFTFYSNVPGSILGPNDQGLLGGQLPVFIGMPTPGMLPGDSGGPPNAELGGYGSVEDVIAQLSNIWGEDTAAATQRYYNMLGQPVPTTPTTPVVTPPVEDTFTPTDPWANLGLPSNISGQDILDYVGTGASDSEIAANMVMAGLTVDQVASVLGMDPDEAQRRFLGGLNEASAADNTGGLWNTAKSIPGTIANSVGGFFDNVFSAVKDVAPFWDQAQVVMGPNGATVVFGQQPSGSPYVPVTNLPQSNTQVGVTTGVPFLDQVINKAMGNPGGANSSTIKDAVIDLVKDQTGLPVDVINSVLKGEIDQAAAEATAVLAQAEAAKNAVTASPDAGVEDEDETGGAVGVPGEQVPEFPTTNPDPVQEAGSAGESGSEEAPPTLEELVPEMVDPTPPPVPIPGTPGETGSEQAPPSETVPEIIVTPPPPLPEPGFEGPGGSESAPDLGEILPEIIDPTPPPLQPPGTAGPGGSETAPPVVTPPPVVPGEPPIETPTTPPPVTPVDPDGPPPETPTTPTTPDTGDLNGLLATLLAPRGGVGMTSVETPDPSDIDYIYDFESIFANPHQAAQFTSPTGVERVAESDLLEYLMRSVQSGQSIDDLLEELKR